MKSIDEIQSEMLTSFAKKRIQQRKQMSGWDDLEGGMEAIELDQKHIDINLLIARTFGTEEGQKVLIWLRETFLEQPTWQPGAEDSFGHWRSGQNTVIRELEARIKRAKNQ